MWKWIHIKIRVIVVEKDSSKVNINKIKEHWNWKVRRLNCDDHCRQLLFRWSKEKFVYDLETMFQLKS